MCFIRTIAVHAWCFQPETKGLRRLTGWQWINNEGRVDRRALGAELVCSFVCFYIDISLHSCCHPTSAGLWMDWYTLDKLFQWPTSLGTATSIPSCMLSWKCLPTSSVGCWYTSKCHNDPFKGNRLFLLKAILVDSVRTMNCRDAARWWYT